MPTTDTFIIPPMTTSEEPKKEKVEKKKTKTSKTLLLVGLLLLIISLPVAIYYITKQQQDIRSRAGAPCSKVNATTCQTVTCPKNAMTKEACEGDPGDLQHLCCKWTSPGSPTPTTRITLPPATATKKPADGGGGATNTPTKKPTEAPTNKPTAKPTTKPTTEPTAEPTTEPTAEPTTEPNTSQCDAACNSDNDCASGLTCSSVDGMNRCRNAECPEQYTCNCPTPTDAPEDTSGDTTGQEMPVSGAGPGIVGSITAIGSIILLIVGLAL